jgi:putative transposase
MLLRRIAPPQAIVINLYNADQDTPLLTVCGQTVAGQRDLPEPLNFLQFLVESVHARRRPMKQSRFTEAQIIGIQKEQEGGTPTAAVCRKHGISSATFYKYKARFGGMNVSEGQRLKSLQDENAKPKKLLAEAMLDMAILKDDAAKKW